MSRRPRDTMRRSPTLPRPELMNAIMGAMAAHQSVGAPPAGEILELRTSTSLARPWQSQGKCRDTYELLAPLYGCFTEGFDTKDLLDAKALLVELDSTSRREATLGRDCIPADFHTCLWHRGSLCGVERRTVGARLAASKVRDPSRADLAGCGPGSVASSQGAAALRARTALIARRAGKHGRIQYLRVSRAVNDDHGVAGRLQPGFGP